MAEKYKDAINALYLGRGYLFPVALEGALKLKEISYIHAEGYAAGEMKHGPIALVDNNLPVVAVAPHDSYYEKIVSNIHEIKARKGNIIAILTEGDNGLKELVDTVVEIPRSHPAVAPLLAVVPLQMLAYHLAVLRGCNVDHPEIWPNRSPWSSHEGFILKMMGITETLFPIINMIHWFSVFYSVGE